MKLLMVSGSLPDIHCGIGDYTSRVVGELARSPGVSVTVLTSDDQRIHLPLAGAAVLTTRWGLGALVGLVRTITRLQPTVVHIQYPAVGYGPALGIVLLPLALRIWSRLPVVLTLHERRERRRAARMAIDLMAVASKLVIVFDPKEASDLKRSLGRFAPPIETGQMISTITFAGNVDRRLAREDFGASEEDLVIASFGLLHPRRRIEDIVDAVAELRRRSVRARLLVIGGEADYDPEQARAYVESLRGKVRDLGLKEVISWLDHASVERVSSSLQSSDVAVLLYPEGVSGRNTTLQAALEHGLPVVTTTGHATPQTMHEQDGLTLLLAGAYTASEVADAVIAAVASRGARVAQPPPPGLRLAEHVKFHLKGYRWVAS